MKISKVRLKEIIKEEINELFSNDRKTILENLSDNSITFEEKEMVKEGILDLLLSLIQKQEDPEEKENLEAVNVALSQLNPDTLRDVQDALAAGITITGNKRAARKTPWDLMETE